MHSNPFQITFEALRFTKQIGEALAQTEFGGYVARSAGNSVCSQVSRELNSGSNERRFGPAGNRKKKRLHNCWRVVETQPLGGRKQPTRLHLRHSQG